MQCVRLMRILCPSSAARHADRGPEHGRGELRAELDPRGDLGRAAELCRDHGDEQPEQGPVHRLGVDVEVILTSPCIFCMGNH